MEFCISLTKLFLLCDHIKPDHTKVYKYDYVLHAFKFGRLYMIFIEYDEGIKGQPPNIVRYAFSDKVVEAIEGITSQPEYENLFNPQDIIFKGD